MTTSSHKRALSLVIGLTLTAALLWASTVGGRTSALQTDQPTNPGFYTCEDGGYQVAFTWNRRMPGNGAWLGNVVVRQGTRTVVDKPIQVFDQQGTDPAIRQFQAQDGSFYCRQFTVTGNKREVSWTDCRSWVLADNVCRRRPPTGTNEP